MNGKHPTHVIILSQKCNLWHKPGVCTNFFECLQSCCIQRTLRGSTDSKPILPLKEKMSCVGRAHGSRCLNIACHSLHFGHVWIWCFPKRRLAALLGLHGLMCSMISVTCQVFPGIMSPFFGPAYTVYLIWAIFYKYKYPHVFVWEHPQFLSLASN